LFFDHYRYFHFVFSHKGAISKIPRLLEIWRNPKTNNIMYKKYMLRDWTSPHLLDCGWYLDYPKENTPPSEFEIHEKHEPIFLQGLGALEKETPCKKRLEGGGKEGKETKLRVQIRDSR
jgi:hypothetical protein